MRSNVGNFYAYAVKSKFESLAIMTRRKVVFHLEEKKLCSFRKAYVGLVENPGMSYNIQDTFNI